MADQAKVMVAQAFFDAWNAHDLSQYDHYEADNMTSEAPGSPGPMNRQQNRMYLQNFLTAFPDSRFEVTLTVADGDYVVMHWVATGVHSGALMTPTGAALEPTGKSARLVGCNTFEIRNGKTVHVWSFWDMTSLLGQLGLMPA